jgi:hypothetical protein
MTCKRILTVTACAAGLWGMGAFAPVEAAEREVAFPHLIICEIKGARHFAWLDTIEADGSAVYMTPSGNFVKLSKDGIMVRQGAAEGNCAGKTVKELIASGQARFIGE